VPCADFRQFLKWGWADGGDSTGKKVEGTTLGLIVRKKKRNKLGSARNTSRYRGERRMVQGRRGKKTSGNTGMLDQERANVKFPKAFGKRIIRKYGRRRHVWTKWVCVAKKFSKEKENTNSAGEQRIIPRKQTSLGKTRAGEKEIKGAM